MTHQRLVTKSSHSDIKATAVADSGLRLWSDHHVPGLQLTTECQDWRRQPINHQKSTGMTGSAGSFQVSGFRTEQSSDCQTSNEERKGSSTALGVYLMDSFPGWAFVLLSFSHS